MSEGKSPNHAFRPRLRTDALKAQIDKLESMDHRAPVTPILTVFDKETEDLLMSLYGDTHQYLEAYKYASLGEAEALVNLPESAQEPMTQDSPKIGIQQRRQVLLGIVADMQESEAGEADALMGEDSEDPPGYS